MEVRLAGRAASPGYARGPIHFVHFDDLGRLPRLLASPPLSDPQREAARLQDAAATAVAELRALVARLEQDAVRNREAIGILGFQVAFLEDAAMLAPVLEVIAAGEPAASAWLAAMGRQIDTYRGADDESFRARASDLRDIRNRVLACLDRDFSMDDRFAQLPPGALLVTDDLQPSRFLAIDRERLAAVVLLQGSAASHVAILARSRGIPMVVGLEAQAADLVRWHGRDAILDARRGELAINPCARSLGEFVDDRERYAAIDALAEGLSCRPARTADGTPVRVCVNVANLADLDAIDPASCDGIGLARTEFLFGDGGAMLRDEDAQFAAYCRLLDWAQGREVTVRTLDAGGDKPIAGLTLEGESNPFLGLRGLRLSLARPEVFRVQLRALARAAARGRIRVMLPMVTMPRELAAANALLEAELVALAREGTAAARPPVGIMVEVPAAAITAADFREAAFFSIGSNDLAQYVAAVGRDVEALAELSSPTQPAMLRLIAGVGAAGDRLGIETSLCGDAASDPAEIAALLGAGLRSLSVAPAQLARVKLAVSRTRLDRSGVDGIIENGSH